MSSLQAEAAVMWSECMSYQIGCLKKGVLVVTLCLLSSFSAALHRLHFHGDEMAQYCFTSATMVVELGAMFLR